MPARGSVRRSRARARAPWRSLAPSLPVFGTDIPPLASTTRRARSGPSSVVTRNPPSAGAIWVARRGCRSRMPALAAAPSSASSTVAARFESGNSLPCGSSCSVTPSSSKNRTVSSTGSARSTRAMTRDVPPLKSRAVTMRFVTLQRPPPLMRILAPSRRAPSMTMTSAAGAQRAAVIAAIKPAAPPPTTRMGSDVLTHLVRR